MDDKNTQELVDGTPAARDLVALAIETLDWSDPSVAANQEVAVTRRALRLRGLLDPDSVPIKTLGATVIYAELAGTRLEESSNRIVVDFAPLVKGVSGDPEQIRTPRLDTRAGKLVDGLLRSIRPGSRVRLYKSHETGRDGRKYRSLVWAEAAR